MIYHRTTCQEAARAWTRISTFLSDASFIGGTIRIYRALGSTIGWNADVILRATARRGVTNSSAQGVGSAR